MVTRTDRLALAGKNGTSTAKRPAGVVLSAAEKKSLDAGMLECRRDAPGLIREMQRQALRGQALRFETVELPQQGKDGLYRDADGNALIKVKLSNTSSALIDPNTNNVYLNFYTTGLGAREMAVDVGGLETAQFKGRFTAAKIKALQDYADAKPVQIEPGAPGSGMDFENQSADDIFRNLGFG
jgi:hypothetical protein